MRQQLQGQIVDITGQNLFPGAVIFENGIIQSILPLPASAIASSDGYILPGFIDAHVHIESSMLVPAEFAKLAVVHGTVTTVSDPHEIANVCGLTGVEYMIENGKTVPFKFHFGAPSCVPATSFETSGATIGAAAVEKLLHLNDLFYLSEMMNFPGVLNGDPEVMQKIAAAHKLGKPVDGHAPGLRGTDAAKYIGAGISTDHECFTAEEALEKLELGMKIIIREGSAARNFEPLIPLLNQFPMQIMFCSDDKHPDSLVEGHINSLCARAIKKGIPLFNILQAACINPILHYGLRVGMLRENDPADFIVVKDLAGFEVKQTYINGTLVAEHGKSLIKTGAAARINHFNCSRKVPKDFCYPLDKWGEQENVEQVYVIEALDGQLVTNKQVVNLGEFKVNAGCLESHVEQDLLKIVVINRYKDAPVAKSFIRNFGLTSGAIASSVAHDSHNIVAVGVDDESLCRAVNLIIDQKGGISCVSGHGKEMLLSLPVAGLMSDEDGYAVANNYTAIDAMAKELGSKLAAPFMTLSFMALLVIPHLKLSDLGLFDGDAFRLL